MYRVAGNRPHGYDIAHRQITTLLTELTGKQPSWHTSRGSQKGNKNYLTYHPMSTRVNFTDPYISYFYKLRILKIANNIQT